MQSFGLEAIAERRRHWMLKKWDIWTNFLEENRQHIFYLFVFYVITICLFVDKFVCESFTNFNVFSNLKMFNRINAKRE
jgi:hypothetical protein